MKNPCPHKNVQQFTEFCFDCGRNSYETEKEYTKAMLEEMLEEYVAKKEKTRPKPKAALAPTPLSAKEQTALEKKRAENERIMKDMEKQQKARHGK